MKVDHNQEEVLYQLISQIVLDRKAETVRQVNKTLVHLYFDVGRIIVENLQDGVDRAEYGDVLKGLANRLTKEFGTGFSPRNLANMRRFYRTYAILQTPSAKL